MDPEQPRADLERIKAAMAEPEFNKPRCQRALESRWPALVWGAELDDGD
jgi:hypothetical protein